MPLDWNTINPYHIIDGPWGFPGCPVNWHRYKWAGNNVFERSYSEKDGYSAFFRVWDTTTESWRAISDEERNKLPLAADVKPTTEETREEVRRFRGACGQAGSGWVRQ